ncbi:efflux RND transporter periplasmic adaptor subunit [Cohaesibacter gelatinilyticus]|uniref:Membrane fusion protein, multidrug efflux system n=1 Tax=Cohaesibacter gelatinilyticus TaxID=372072 RepID=A0A285NHD4_9HYPH|nr:efflux RND transporter periplasmic adaptor subunit [Cohaesibacter gelatinilyticus]SNZ07286.1 membrane fusion protein, multidrug efflux system [Cohaesibacter gelatinilyticus]
MALRIKGSYGLALLFSACITGWLATGTMVVSGQSDENGAPPPALRDTDQQKALTRVAVQDFKAQQRDNLLVIRGRTQADTKVVVRSETDAIVRSRPISKGQQVQKGDLLCELDKGSRQARLAQAKAALAKADFDLNAKERLKKKGFATTAELTALRANRDAALAQVEEATLEMARTHITAPFDGIVQGPLAEIGDQLNRGGACATVMNADPMLIIGQVSERDIQQVKSGLEADVTLVTGESTKGMVRYVSTASDVETRTFRVEVEVSNSDHSLRDGVTATANLHLPQSSAHLMSPAHLTLSDDGTIGVMRLEGKKAAFTPLTTFTSAKNGVWVSGLPSEVTLIVVGQEYVKDGQLVDAVPVADFNRKTAASQSGDSQS